MGCKACLRAVSDELVGLGSESCQGFFQRCWGGLLGRVQQRAKELRATLLRKISRGRAVRCRRQGHYWEQSFMRVLNFLIGTLALPQDQASS